MRIKLRTKKRIQGIVASWISVVLLGLSVLPVQATTTLDVDTVKEQIKIAKGQLEELFQTEYEDSEKTVKGFVTENNLDYTLTMESYYEQANPFKSADYIGIIASYMCIKEELVKTGSSLKGGLADIPLLNVGYTEQTLIETVPASVITCTQDEDGNFIKTGTQFYTEPASEINYYTENGDGTCSYIGKINIAPVKQDTLYGEISLSLMNLEDMWNYYGLTYNEQTVMDKITLLNNAINGEILNQSMFLNFADGTITDQEIEKYASSLTGGRKNIVSSAISLLGKVPYEWGGKSSTVGYDTSWWSYDNDNMTQKGLDCSGFVSWAYHTAGVSNWQDVMSTAAIRENLTFIDESELQPGDIGLLNLGESVNHTGIYLGDGYFIHCSSSKNTVVIDKFCFKYFLRDEDVDKINIDFDSLEVYPIYNYTDSADESDVETLAKLMQEEALGEGINGWIAVGEVVKNRVASAEYPNSISEVVYSGQFSTTKFNTMELDPDVVNTARAVLEGNLTIFNNNRVMYFKNTQITDGISANIQKDWGKYKYYTAVGHHAFYLQP